MKTFSRLFITAFLVLAFGILHAQKKALEKADEYFKNGAYAAAMPLYETALEEKANMNAMTKLAYCYKMNNRLTEAETLYEKIVLDKKARPITFFYYGEVLMGNEKYEEAKSWFRQYQLIEPEDEQVPTLIRACDEVPLIKPFFEKIQVVPFDQNSDADDNSAVFWNGGIAFTSDRKTGVKILKQKSGWTGRDFLKIYFSQQKSSLEFEEAQPLSSRLNELNKNSGNTSFALDSSEVFFTRNSNLLNNRNAYALQLFRAQHQGQNRWKEVEKLEFCHEGSNYMHPAIAPDKQSLFFVADKPGGQGGTDIFEVKRVSETEWGRPENLGPVVNSSGNEGFPFVDAQGRLFFCSKGHPGYGGFDIFMTTRDATGQWTKPVNLGKPINSSLDDISISLDITGRKGLFSSSRNGGDDDIFLFFLPDDHGNFPTTETDIFASEKARTPENNRPEIRENPPTEDPAKTISPDQGSEHLPKKKREVEFPNTHELLNATSKPQKVKLADTLATDPLFAATPSAKQGDLMPMKNLNDLEQMASTNELQPGQIFVLENVKYPPDAYLVAPEMEPPLNRLAGLLTFYQDLKIEIGGHTEKLGDTANNQTLSRYRAEAIRGYLLKTGIEEERIKTKGYGSTSPLNSCSSDEDCNLSQHLINQRVEIKIL